MISIESRYVTDKVIRITEDGSTKSVIVPNPVRTVTFDFTYYQWLEGDRVDIVAQSYFDDERLWYLIADANPEILVWSEVPVGTVIRIPSG